MQNDLTQAELSKPDVAQADRQLSLNAVIAAAPCTAQDPNLSGYDRGFFDAVIAYQKAVSGCASQ